jgi:glutaconate CoA-transferase subunit A
VRDKLTTIDQAVAEIPSGSSIGLGGATMRRKPMALVRALASTEAAELDLWTWLGSTDADLLVACGKVRSINSAYVGFGAFGLAQTSRRAFVDGSVEFGDWSESSLVAAFRAGATGMPFAVTRALLGTGMGEEIAKDLEAPFGGPPVQAVPAARPDFALIHAQSADRYGNVRRRQPNNSDDIDHVIAASAGKVIVSVEEVDDHETILANRDETLIPGHYIHAVVHAPRGAFPTGCDGYYHPDLDHMKTYAEASKTADGVEQYIDRYVRGVSPEDFFEKIGGEEAVR